jgi:predicted KAP-like P-loop ATPase
LARALVDPDTRRSTGIVVGVTGEWGSGKSSILNLVSEKIKREYPDGLIVRFDPGLFLVATT